MRDPLHYIRSLPREHTANVADYRPHRLNTGRPAAPDMRPRVRIDATGIDPDVWPLLTLLNPERYHYWQVPITQLLHAAYTAHVAGEERFDDMLEEYIPSTHMAFDCDECRSVVVVDVSQPAPALGTNRRLIWVILGLDFENTRASWFRHHMLDHEYAHAA